MRKGEKREYEYLSAEVIKKACSGDTEALSQVVIRYRNYARKCFKNAAESKYKLNMRKVPVEDLMQEVWMDLTRVLVGKFVVC